MINFGKKLATISAGIILICLAQTTLAQGWTTESMGGFSTVHIYTPASDSKIGSGKALMLILHGCTQSASAFKTAMLEDAAEASGYIIAAPEAQYKQGFGCWGYWTGAPTRTGFGNDYVNIFGLVDALKARENIDPDQVYISGFSSGGAFAMETGCLAPDVFAGMGITAGPSAGTSAAGSMGGLEGTAASTAAACLSYAGSYSDGFDTQIFNGAAGTDATGSFIGTDGLVNRGYALNNTSAMAQIYGVDQLSGTTRISGGQGAIETRWEDDRITMTALIGTSHQWSGGPGAYGSYVGNASINYGEYLMNFFTNSNKRVEQINPPELAVYAADVNEYSVTISGNATDDDAIASVTVYVDGAANSVSINSSGDFNLTLTDLATGLYEYYVTAVDTTGASTTSTLDTFQIGTIPLDPPTITVDAPVVNNQSVTISGDTADADGEVTEVYVTLDGQEYSANISGGSYSVTISNLSTGEYSATVTAVDNDNLTASTSTAFTVAEVANPWLDWWKAWWDLWTWWD